MTNRKRTTTKDTTPKVTEAQIDMFDPAVRTVANRIYYALNRIQLLRLVFDRDGDPLPSLDYEQLDGLCDALDDIERALEPLTESNGGLPNGADELWVRDVLLSREHEYRKARHESNEVLRFARQIRARERAGQ